MDYNEHIRNQIQVERVSSMLFFGLFKKKKKKEEPKPVEPKPVEKEEPVEEELVVEQASVQNPEVVAEETHPTVDPEPVEEDVPVEEEPKEEEKPEVDLASLTVVELKELAKDKGLTGYSSLKKAELIDLLK